MKKKILALMLTVLLALSSAACSSAPVSSAASSSQSSSEASSSKAQATAAPEASQAKEDVNYVVPGKSTNLLTGQETLSEEAYGKRPVALSVNNISDSWPQYGIGAADIIFEIPVEYNITRLMAVYGDYTKIPDVCSIRSCRYYYPILAEGMDAAYFHSGMDNVHALGILQDLGITTYDTTPGELFARDQNRLDEGYALEHTMMFYGEKVPAAMEENGIRSDLDAAHNDTAFKFAKAAAAPAGDGCTQARVFFSDDYYSDFTYDEGTKTYFKGHSGTPHMDEATDRQLDFTNLLILETTIENFEGDEAGRKEIDLYGDHYKGYYVSEGKVQGITWSKADPSSALKIYDGNGDELLMNQGKTYVAMCTPDSATFGTAAE